MEPRVHFQRVLALPTSTVACERKNEGFSIKEWVYSKLSKGWKGKRETIELGAGQGNLRLTVNLAIKITAVTKLSKNDIIIRHWYHFTTGTILQRNRFPPSKALPPGMQENERTNIQKMNTNQMNKEKQNLSQLSKVINQ